MAHHQFDPAAAPLVVYCGHDSDEPDLVCTWRWWGPRKPFDVIGWVVAARGGLILDRILVVAHGSQIDELGGFDADASRVVSGESLTTTDLRGVPINRLMAQVHGEMVTRLRSEPAVTGDQWAHHLRAVGQSAVPPTKAAGRPGLLDDLLYEVAVAFLDEFAAGPGVHRRIADRFGVGEGKARDWIRAARQRGYLEPAGKSGRRSAAPGPLLLDALYADWSDYDGTPLESRTPSAKGPWTPQFDQVAMKQVRDLRDSPQPPF